MSHKKPAVLVVDDEIRVRRLLEMTMEAEGYQVFSAKGGKIFYCALPAGEHGYTPDKLVHYGDLEISDRKMKFYPNHENNDPIDFTNILRVVD